jgi:hypothetical protein
MQEMNLLQINLLQCLFVSPFSLQIIIIIIILIPLLRMTLVPYQKRRSSSSPRNEHGDRARQDWMHEMFVQTDFCVDFDVTHYCDISKPASKSFLACDILWLHIGTKEKVRFDEHPHPQLLYPEVFYIKELLYHLGCYYSWCCQTHSTEEFNVMINWLSKCRILPSFPSLLLHFNLDDQCLIPPSYITNEWYDYDNKGKWMKKRGMPKNDLFMFVLLNFTPKGSYPFLEVTSQSFGASTSIFHHFRTIMSNETQLHEYNDSIKKNFTNNILNFFEPAIILESNRQIYKVEETETTLRYIVLAPDNPKEDNHLLWMRKYLSLLQAQRPPKQQQARLKTATHSPQLPPLVPYQSPTLLFSDPELQIAMKDYPHEMMLPCLIELECDQTMLNISEKVKVYAILWFIDDIYSTGRQLDKKTNQYHTYYHRGHDKIPYRACFFHQIVRIEPAHHPLQCLNSRFFSCLNYIPRLLGMDNTNGYQLWTICTKKSASKIFVPSSPAKKQRKLNNNESIPSFVPPEDVAQPHSIYRLLRKTAFQFKNNTYLLDTQQNHPTEQSKVYTYENISEETTFTARDLFAYLCCFECDSIRCRHHRCVHGKAKERYEGEDEDSDDYVVDRDLNQNKKLRALMEDRKLYVKASSKTNSNNAKQQNNNEFLDPRIQYTHASGDIVLGSLHESIWFLPFFKSLKRIMKYKWWKLEKMTRKSLESISITQYGLWSDNVIMNKTDLVKLEKYFILNTNEILGSSCFPNNQTSFPSYQEETYILTEWVLKKKYAQILPSSLYLNKKHDPKLCLGVIYLPLKIGFLNHYNDYLQQVQEYLFDFDSVYWMKKTEFDQSWQRYYKLHLQYIKNDTKAWSKEDKIFYENVLNDLFYLSLSFSTAESRLYHGKTSDTQMLYEIIMRQKEVMYEENNRHIVLESEFSSLQVN